MSCLKKNIKIYIKIYIETAPTCFGVTVTLSSGVTVTPKHVGAVFDVNYHVNFNIVFLKENSLVHQLVNK